MATATTKVLDDTSRPKWLPDGKTAHYVQKETRSGTLKRWLITDQKPAIGCPWQTERPQVEGKLAEYIGSETVRLRWQRAIRDMRGSALPPDMKVATFKHVLLTLSTYMDGEGWDCFPRIRRLCADVSRKKKTVLKVLATAEELGWLRRIPCRRYNGGKTSNWYLPSLPQTWTEEE